MERTHAPAWYLDPAEPGRLRRWDGAAWTDETKPIPSWLYGYPIARGPVRRYRQPRTTAVRRLWAVATICLATAVVLLLALSSTLTPATVESERVSDAAFLAGAAEACTRANEGVLEPLRRGLDERPGLTARLDDVAEDLHQIEFVRTGDDGDRIESWIAAWDALADDFRLRNAAVRRGDDKRVDEIHERLLATRMAINRFVYANGLTVCEV